NWKCGIGHVEAREKVRTARALRDLPLIDEAFSRGEISYSKVRAMTRAATPENEQFLLQIAQYGTAEHVERLVRKYRRFRKLNEPFDEMDDWRKEKQCFWYEDDWGMFNIHLKLPPEDGAVVVKALEALVEQLKEEKEPERQDDVSGGDSEEQDGRDDNTKNDSNDANNVSAETFLKVDPEHWEAKRADAMTLMAEHCLKNLSDNVKSGGRFEILMHVNANPEHPDYKVSDGPCCYLDDGYVLAPEVLRRLACDAAVTTVLEDDKGSVLNVGRRQRSVPPAIEKAVRVRDQGCCRFPGCCRTKWTQMHHIVHWSLGGETSLDNLVTLCRRHHRLLHDGEYRIHKDEGRDLVFINRNNEIIKRSLYPQFPGVQRCDELERENRRRGLEIDADTAVTRWTG
ncbi:MAG: DUF222 domain-containing protein, partial [Pseudomonadales bacterium]|nr:DUF222 domain-containing protein [Pseudomonadales bacterium]